MAAEAGSAGALYENKHLPILDELRSRLGPERFQHEFADATLLRSNLVTQSGERIFETAAGYDQPIRVQALENLFRVLHELMKAER